MLEPRGSREQAGSNLAYKSNPSMSSSVGLVNPTNTNADATFERLLVEFQQKHTDYLRKVQNSTVDPAALGYSMLWEYYTSKLDAEVKVLILDALEEYSDFDSARGALRVVLDFQDVPQEFRVTGGTCDESIRFLCTNPLDVTDVFRPIVMFKHSRVADGVIYVCQNAFLTSVERKTMLVRGEPYSIIQTETDVVTSDVMDDYPNDSICPPITELPHVIVDLIDVGNRFPVALCIAGPQGRGLFVDMVTYEYSESDGHWQPRGFGGEWDGFSGWWYSAMTKQFGLYGHLGHGTSETEEINVLEGLSG